MLHFAYGSSSIKASSTKFILTNDSFEIIASTINLCHKLDKTVVAEGVETAEQLLLLKGLHCDEIQGYYYSKPIEEPTLREFLKQSKWIESIKNKHIVKINQRKFFRIQLEVPILANNSILPGCRIEKI